jgi:hypothetical protein
MGAEGPSVPSALAGAARARITVGILRPQVDAQRQDPVLELGLGVADHGEVGEILLGLLAEPLALGPLDRRHAPGADGLGSLAESGHHLLRVEAGHGGQRRCCIGDRRRLLADARLGRVVEEAKEFDR